MAFEIVFHPDVKGDLASLNERLRVRMRTAMLERLAIAPHQYGDPLRKTLKGYWKLRVGDYRVVYKIIGKEVRILGILHRKDVYEKIGKRGRSNRL